MARTREQAGTRQDRARRKAGRMEPEASFTPATRLAGEAMLTRHDLARQLRVSTRTVSEWQRDGVIPYIKVGKIVLFHWPDVVSALRERYSVAGSMTKDSRPEDTKEPRGK